MIAVDDIPGDWKLVLSLVQEEYPGAIIAGGSLRDLVHGKTVKDVDIFVPVNLKPDTQKLMGILNIKEHELNPERKANVDRKIYAIYHLTYNGVEYELVFGSPEACDIKTFDINICQIQFDGMHVNATQHFRDGVQDRIVRFINPQSEKRQNERADRIKVKYPEYGILLGVPVKGISNGY